MTKVTKLLSLLLIVSAYWAFQQLSPNVKNNLFATSTNSEANQHNSTTNQHKKEPIDHAFERLTANYKAPLSEWLNQEKQRYQQLLANEKYDVLIVPFQVNGYAFDRSTRSLMTALLASELSKQSNLKLPDPYILARALGDGQRHYDSNEVIAYAKRLGVKNIIWGYVGHDLQNNLSVNIQFLDNSSLPTFNDSSSKDKRYKTVSTFDDETPAIEVFQKLIPAILETFEIPVLKTADKDNSEFTLKLTDDPTELFSQKHSFVSNAYIYQTLAYLTPTYAERTRERFIEKSLLALSEVSPSVPEYNALKARAYKELGMRPAALNVLAEANTNEEKALFAALNGNLPNVELHAKHINSVIKQFLTALDANNIATFYQVRNREESVNSAKSVAFPSELWQFFAARAFTDWDLWAQFDNIYIKALLDDKFPLPGFSAKEIINGALALSDSENVQIISDLSTIEHIQKLHKTHYKLWCCQVSYKPKLSDYIELLESTASDNLFRRARFYTTLQGRPEHSIDFLKKIEHIYNGHPEFSLVKSMANNGLAAKADGIKRKSLKVEADQSATNAIFWSQGQEWISQEAHQIRKGAKGNVPNYAYDIPLKPYFSQAFETSYVLPHLIQSNLQRALANSTKRFWPVKAIIHHSRSAKDEHAVDELLKSVEGRFGGSSELPLLLARRASKRGDYSTAEKYYRQVINDNPMLSIAFEELGMMLFSDAKVEQSYDVFMSYPGFKDSQVNKVGSSNSAYTWGSLFYWSGHFDEAISLYKLAEDLNTGSAGSVTSSLRLKILDGDYLGALEGTIRRATRYNSHHAYRDYFGMLHAMGYTEDAWDAFNVLINQQPNPYIWQTAIVGHRLASQSESAIADWAKNYQQSPNKRADKYAATYLLRSSITDRTPDKALAREITLVNDPENVVQQHSSKAFLSKFAEVYRLIKVNNFVEAKLLLEDSFKNYNQVSHTDRQSFQLPYYAFAAYKANDVDNIERLLSNSKVNQKKYDYFLSKAVLSGLQGEKETSLEFLNKALYNRPYTDHRPVYTEYQYAEICELLYLETNQQEYKSLMLDWAQKVKTVTPWYSWPYAFLAKYEDDPKVKGKAIAMVSYLDKNSERLNSLEETEISAAVEKYSGLNLFLNIVEVANKRNI